MDHFNKSFYLMIHYELNKELTRPINSISIELEMRSLICDYFEIKANFIYCILFKGVISNSTTNTNYTLNLDIKLNYLIFPCQ